VEAAGETSLGLHHGHGIRETLLSVCDPGLTPPQQSLQLGLETVSQPTRRSTMQTPGLLPWKKNLNVDRHHMRHNRHHPTCLVEEQFYPHCC